MPPEDALKSHAPSVVNGDLLRGDHDGTPVAASGRERAGPVEIEMRTATEPQGVEPRGASGRSGTELAQGVRDAVAGNGARPGTSDASSAPAPEHPPAPGDEDGRPRVLTPAGSPIAITRVIATDMSLITSRRLWEQKRTLLADGPFRLIWTLTVLAPGVAVGHERSWGTQHIQLEALEDFLWVGYPVGRTGAVRQSGRELLPGEAVVAVRGGKQDVVAPGGLDLLQLMFLPSAFGPQPWQMPQETGRERLDSLPDAFARVFGDIEAFEAARRRWVERGTFTVAPSPRTERLATFLRDIAALELAPESWAHVPAAYLRDQLAWHVAVALHEARPRKERARRGRTSLRRMTAVAVHEYLERHAERAVSLLELARHVGVSERTLQAACLEEFGVPAGRYCRAVRLGHVRAALLRGAPGQSVHGVAARYGFLQMGRFATHYARLFGEAPSRTLAAARARQGIAKAP